MENSEDPPTAGEVKEAMQLLSSQLIGVVDRDEQGYQLTTDYENGVRLAKSVRNVIASSKGTNG